MKNKLNVEHHDESQKHRRRFLNNSSKKVVGTNTREEFFLNESSNPFLINLGHIYSSMAPETNLKIDPNSVTKLGDRLPNHHSNSNRLPM